MDRRNHRLLLVMLLTVFVFFAGCMNRPCVLVTGYWPPTNEMLRPFSKNRALNPHRWQGKNWQGTGYDVVAFFPVFEKGTDVNPKGSGDFEVDYQDTLGDFRWLTLTLRPEAIICYGQGDGPWEIEQNIPFRQHWRYDYKEPKLPDCFCGYIERHDFGDVLASTLPVEKIEENVSNNVPGMRAWVDWEGDPGDFLCGYLAFLAADYQQTHENCKAAGFIHVGGDVDVLTARKANEVTLKTVIENIR